MSSSTLKQQSSTNKHSTATAASSHPSNNNHPAHRPLTVERTPEAIIEYLIPSDSTYFTLRAIEKQIDEKLIERQQKLADIQFKKERSPRRLLIRIGNSSADQPAPGVVPVVPFFEGLPEVGGSGRTTNEDLFRNPPSWTLKIEGKLEPTVGRPSRFAPPPFMHWIKGFKAEFTNDLGQLVFMEEWRKEQNTKLSDAIVIKRTGSEALNVRILLDVDYHVEKFRLSKPLSDILQVDIASKAYVVVLLWQYIKINKLQVSEKAIHADKALASIFGVEKMLLSDIPVLVSQHLFPPEPLVLQYRLHLEVANFTSSEVYELSVDYDESSLRLPKLNHPALLTLAGDISLLEKRINENIEILKVSIANERLMRMMATDPVGCLQKCLKNQARDIRSLTGDVASFSFEDLYRDELFQGQSIEYALFDYAHSSLK